MNYAIIITAAVLPAILLFLYVWRKDQKKEPAWQLIKAVLWGAAICVPVAYAEVLINMFLFGSGTPSTLIGTTAEAFLIAALPEETFKLLALWIVLRRNPYFDEHFDGIVYAVCVGLGFAAVENIGYVVGSDNWATTAIVRALLAVPGHYAFAVMMGYYYSVYHFVRRSTKNAVCILLVPVMAHGVYDALALSGTANPIIGGLSFVVLIYFCIKLHKLANAKVQELVIRDMQ